MQSWEDFSSVKVIKCYYFYLSKAQLKEGELDFNQPHLSRELLTKF